jgi:hypothetical protein
MVDGYCCRCCSLLLLSARSQSPVVARKPLVQCQAAAAEVVEAGSSSESKAGVAHLRFKRGSAFKVRVWPSWWCCCRCRPWLAAATCEGC